MRWLIPNLFVSVGHTNSTGVSCWWKFCSWLSTGVDLHLQNIAWSVFLHLKPNWPDTWRSRPYTGPRAHTQSFTHAYLPLWGYRALAKTTYIMSTKIFAPFSFSLTSHFAVISTATPTSAYVFSLFLPFICFVCVTSIGASVCLPSRIYYTTWSGSAYTSICAAMTTDLSHSHSQITAVMWPPHATRIESHCAKTLTYAHVDTFWSSVHYAN